MVLRPLFLMWLPWASVKPVGLFCFCGPAIFGISCFYRCGSTAVSYGGEVGISCFYRVGSTADFEVWNQLLLPKWEHSRFLGGNQLLLPKWEHSRFEVGSVASIPRWEHSRSKVGISCFYRSGSTTDSKKWWDSNGGFWFEAPVWFFEWWDSNVGFWFEASILVFECGLVELLRWGLLLRMGASVAVANGSSVAVANRGLLSLFANGSFYRE